MSCKTNEYIPINNKDGYKDCMKCIAINGKIIALNENNNIYTTNKDYTNISNPPVGKWKITSPILIGAFYTEAPVCPIIIKYNKIPYADSFNEFLLKIVSIRNINIDVYINDFFYPPFNDQKIEYVRNYMAKTGNLNISRVSNKSIKN